MMQWVTQALTPDYSQAIYQLEKAKKYYETGKRIKILRCDRALADFSV